VLDLIEFMENQEEKKSTEVLRNLPSIDTLLRSETSSNLIGKVGAKHLAGLARLVTDSLRQELLQEINSGKEFDADQYSREILLKEAELRLEDSWQQEQNTGLQRVINASGVVIHTNLGRSALSEAARQAMLDASHYCNLEYNIETGKRGKRGARAEHLLAELTGAESALIVNNCAAACVLVLTALCKGGEAIISRGELVEIGGDFRVPDVMIQSGAELVEVGTTNKTRASDYEKAITENTRLITKVHPSNYRIIGFTSTPGVAELAEIAQRNNVLLYEDAGSGAMFDMSEYGLKDEPIIPDSIKAGADIVTFSGDKLLGGIQSGLIVGRGDVIEQIRKNPLYRALRVSKLVYAVLETALDAFRRETVMEDVPTLKMLAMTKVELKKRTWAFAQKFREKIGENTDIKFEIGDGNSVIGGGSAPAVQPETTLFAIKHKKLSASQIEEKLRHSKPPVVARILDDRVLLDLRTVMESEEAELLEVLSEVGKE
jgi:L-seryl-tRNA(Ser) seleniumtransferase